MSEESTQGTGGYAPVPWEAWDVWGPRLGAYGIAVLGYMIRRAGTSGLFFASCGAIARAVGCRRQTALAAVQLLESIGWVRRASPAGDQRVRTVVYQLCQPPAPAPGCPSGEHVICSLREHVAVRQADSTVRQADNECPLNGQGVSAKRTQLNPQEVIPADARARTPTCLLNGHAAEAPSGPPEAPGGPSRPAVELASNWLALWAVEGPQRPAGERELVERGMGELLRQGGAEAELAASIADPDRDRFEFFSAFRRRWSQRLAARRKRLANRQPFAPTSAAPGPDEAEKVKKLVADAAARSRVW